MVEWLLLTLAGLGLALGSGAVAVALLGPEEEERGRVTGWPSRAFKRGEVGYGSDDASRDA